MNSKRALAVDSADSLSDSEGEHSTEDTPTGLKERLCQATRSAKSESSGLDRVSGSDSEVVTSSEASPSSSHDSVEAASRTAPDSIGSVIHVYDVEQDSTEGRESDSQPLSQSPDPGSGITLNGERLLRQQVPAAAENNYVYDLYYINSNGQQYDFRDLENILSIEALHDELVCESDRQEECNDVYDDDDDSNDENNWRNDYPDEDPDQSDREQDEFGFGFGYGEFVYCVCFVKLCTGFCSFYPGCVEQGLLTACIILSVFGSDWWKGLSNFYLTNLQLFFHSGSSFIRGIVNAKNLSHFMSQLVT